MRNAGLQPSQGKSVTTLEGLPALYASQKKLAKAPDLHPVQQAMIDEQAVQCGYCFNGMITKASELLFQKVTCSRMKPKSVPR